MASLCGPAPSRDSAAPIVNPSSKKFRCQCLLLDLVLRLFVFPRANDLFLPSGLTTPSFASQPTPRHTLYQQIALWVASARSRRPFVAAYNNLKQTNPSSIARLLSCVGLVVKSELPITSNGQDLVLEHARAPGSIPGHSRFFFPDCSGDLLFDRQRSDKGI